MSRQASHGGQVWAAARQLGLSPGQILDFSANLNPFGPPPAVMECLRRNLSSVAWYPEPHAAALKRRLAEAAGRPPGEVAVGNGASELIYLSAQVLRPRKALIVSPTFGEYERALRFAGVAAPVAVERFYLAVPRHGGEPFRLPVDRLLARLRCGSVDLVVVCNPNNPTGTLVAGDDLAAISRAARAQGAWLLLDASFLDFLPAPEVGLPPEPWDRLIILKSLTKLYCLPGLRLGYMVAPADLVAAVEAARDPWSVNALAQIAGLQCLREEAYVARTREALPRFRRGLEDGLRWLGRSCLPGLEVYPSAANFLLGRVPAAAGGAASLASRLVGRGILIRVAADFVPLDETYFRLAVRLPEENDRLLAQLQALFSAG